MPSLCYNKPQKKKLDENINIMGEDWKMHDEGIVEKGESRAMLEEGIVTITMIETCKWTHNETPKALGYCTLKFDQKKKKKKTLLTFSHGKKGGA